MDIPSWIVNGDPTREVINYQGVCKCHCDVTSEEDKLEVSSFQCSRKRV